MSPKKRKTAEQQKFDEFYRDDDEENEPETCPEGYMEDDDCCPETHVGIETCEFCCPFGRLD